MQIEAEILGQHLALEDVVEQLAVARPDQDRVVARRRRSGGACRNTRGTGPSNNSRGRSCDRSSAAAPTRAGDGDRSRRNRRWRRRCRRRSSRRSPAARPVAAPFSTMMASTSQLQRTSSALALDQVDEARDERAGAAHGEMHAPALLQRGDQAVDGAGAERIAADQQRMEAEDGAQALVTEMLRDQRIDAAIALQAHEVRRDARHVERRTKRGRRRAARNRCGRFHGSSP